MSEILFRGKRLDNGEWTEGSLLKVTLNGKTAHLIFGDNFSFVGNDVKALSHALVDPATVGQYTGLTDKNGERIWEGNVVRITIPVKDAKPITQISHVYYSKGCFCVNWCGGYPEHHRTRLDDFCYSVAFEVIGNCHDNAELLKEA